MARETVILADFCVNIVTLNLGEITGLYHSASLVTQLLDETYN